MADYALKQGDTSIVLTDTLTYSDGSAVSLSGASVKFVMRALTSNTTTTNAAATITNSATGAVSYQPTATDTATAGDYMANWIVTFSDTTVEQFPTVGYMTVTVEQNLTTPGGSSIVSLGRVKDHLNIPANNRTNDGELLRMIAGVTPVVENLVGPVVQRIYQNETYDGGGYFISLRHRPVIQVQSVVEYRGPIRYELTQVVTPDLGTIYSYMFEPPGRIVRRTVGGGMVTFPPGYDQVFVTYTAGYQTVPEDITFGTCELIRVNYQQTQQAGRRPFGANMDDELMGAQQMMGYFVPGRVRELLQAHRRHPSLS